MKLVLRWEAGQQAPAASSHEANGRMECKAREFKDYLVPRPQTTQGAIKHGDMPVTVKSIKTSLQCK